MNIEAEKPPRISKIWARNFKSIDHLELDLSPFTVLVGPNASGKSNIADIPKFISDAVSDDLDIALMSRGRAALKHSTRRANVVVGAEIEFSYSCLTYEFSFQMTAGNVHRVKREVLKLRAREGLEVSTLFEISNGRVVRPADVVPQDVVKFVTEDLELLAIPKLWPAMLRDRAEAGIPDDLQTLVAVAMGLLRDVRSYHIFPNVLRDPQRAESKHQLSGSGSNLASVLHDMKTKNPERWIELLSSFRAMVPSVSGIDVRTAGSHLFLHFTHEPEYGDGPKVLGAAQESDGTLRLLGLLAAMYQDPPARLVVMEEPELAVHPGALPYLAELIEETARLRAPVLATTHSPDFLDLVPVDSIRAVQMVNGGTTAAPVSEHQRSAVAKKLFTPGEIHRMEGLRPGGVVV